MKKAHLLIALLMMLGVGLARGEGDPSPGEVLEALVVASQSLPGAEARSRDLSPSVLQLNQVHLGELTDQNADLMLEVLHIVFTPGQWTGPSGQVYDFSRATLNVSLGSGERRVGFFYNLLDEQIIRSEISSKLVEFFDRASLTAAERSDFTKRLYDLLLDGPGKALRQLFITGNPPDEWRSRRKDGAPTYDMVDQPGVFRSLNRWTESAPVPLQNKVTVGSLTSTGKIRFRWTGNPSPAQCRRMLRDLNL